MKFLSVCSGIEAASAAWHPIGWEPVAFSEIEPFPCAVLAHHYPHVPNHGDMTKFQEWPDHAIDLLCGGTPCQSFSVAGLRKGLDDPRGNLMLTFGAIAAKYRPKWLVWENVPGVLSSNGGRDFGAFLGMLWELGYGFAYRVLDAQYHGVAQRRRRVFVVGCLGDWRSAAAVLFERHSLSGDSAPSRKTGEGASHSVAPCLTSSGRGVERCGDTRGQDPVVAVCPTLRAGGNKTGGDRPPGTDVDTADSLIVTHTLRGEGFDASEDGTGRGTPLVPALAGTICRDSFSGGMGGRPEGAAGGHVVPVLAAGAHAPAICVSLRGREGGATAELGDEVGNCLRASSGGGDKPHVLAYTTKLHNTQSNNAGKIFEERSTCLDANSPAPALLTAMQVRRLTPIECERLQGFPDNFTQIPWRKKPADQCPDGPRYKALGNSWAVPVARWIGERINAVEAIKSLKEAA